MRKEIKIYNNLIKVVRIGRAIEVSREMEIELKRKYAGICGESGIRNSSGDDRDSDDSDGEDLEAYNSFVSSKADISWPNLDKRLPIA